jgi:hypothetical protein
MEYDGPTDFQEALALSQQSLGFLNWKRDDNGRITEWEFKPRLGRQERIKQVLLDFRQVKGTARAPR